VDITGNFDGSSLKILVFCHAVRAAKFVVRKSWIVCGSDDMQVRVYNYNTLEKVSTFEAHTDYIRSIIVHPTHPYILTSSGKNNLVTLKMTL